MHFHFAIPPTFCPTDVGIEEEGEDIDAFFFPIDEMFSIMRHFN